MAVNPVLVEVERSGFIESRHRGAAVGLDPDGSQAIRLGEIEVPIFPRSANKPMQAVAMLRHGLALDGELLALATASHSGEDFHVDGVRRILAGAGLTAAALRCPEAWPLDQNAARELARSGGGPTRPHMNCSGKHAAMLATCVINGWPTDSYLDVGHRLQVAIRETVEELTAEEVTATGVDGCGAPLFAASLTGVARAFRTLALAAPGTPQRRLVDAMRMYPEWTSGSHRDERRLMKAVPGLVVKCGAEGVDAFAFADGRAGAIKITDGAQRARTPVTVALLRALGVAAGEVKDGVDVPVGPASVSPVPVGSASIDRAALDELATVPVHGGGEVVGAIRPAAALFPGPSVRSGQAAELAGL